jgi:DNA polymerase-3 subunit delta
VRPFTLVTSDDDLLLRRGVERVLADLPDGTEVERHDVDEEGLPDVRTASLFGGDVVHLLRFGRVPSGGLLEEVRALAAAEVGGPVVVACILHGAGRVPATIDKLADVAGRDAHVAVAAPPDWADEQWDRLVGEEFRRRGRHADASAIRAVRTHAGLDASTISVQVASVCAATPVDVDPITEEEVDAVVVGHGRQSGFAIADAVVARDAGAALAASRGALEAGDAPVMLAGALAYRLRQLLVLRGGGDGRAAGLGRRPVSGGRLRALTNEARGGFSPGELAWAVDRLAQLDVDLKGSDLPSDLVFEAAVVDLATRRDVDPLRPTHTRRPFPVEA